MYNNFSGIEKKPSSAYNGSEPYIFVSHASEDVKLVFPEIKLLQDLGYNVWYDEDINFRSKNIDKNLEYIDDCELVIVFVSNNSTSSKKVKKEFGYAINEGKFILAICFDDLENIPMSSGWKYELLDINKIFLDKGDYISKVVNFIQDFRENKNVDSELIPYNVGDGPYIYVSYGYNDFSVVYKEIRRLQDMGCDVRFDEGAGFLKESLRQIENCDLLVVFISHETSTSKVKNDVNYAISKKKSILPVYLEDLDELQIDSELKNQLSHVPAIFKTNFDEGEYSSKLSKRLQNFGILPKDSTNSKLIPSVGREPLPAYRGENPYVFVSYAHKDSYRVFPEIKRFQDLDYNIWYDEGIAPANEWLEDILEHLDNCALVINFVTKNSLASVNVKKEIKYARYENKPIIPIYLDDFDELNFNRDWKAILSDIQGILKANMGDEEFIFKCTEAFERFGFDPYPENLFEKIELKVPQEVLLDDALKNDVLYSDINSESISCYIDDFFDDLTLYDDYHNGHCYKNILKSSIDVFLEYKSSYTAFEVYRTFFMIYQIISGDKSDLVSEPNTLLDLVETMKDYVQEPGDLIERKRDLFIHSVNVFLLGLTIYSQNRNYRRVFKNYIKHSDYEKYYKNEDGRLSHEEFLYRWGITSLLHDIYYPFEKNAKDKNSKIYEEFDIILGKDRHIGNFDDLNQIYKYDPYFADNYRQRYRDSKIMDLFKPTEIITHKIAHNFKFDMDQMNKVKNNIDALVDFINDTEFEEHGLLSAILVLNSYGYQIQGYDKDSDYFFYPIVDSATAIFLHNYYKYFLQREPFNLGPLYVESYPLAFMLMLCDNILEFKKSETISDENINEIYIHNIDNQKFNASYIVKSSSYGFGFSNELFLDDILDIGGTIFPEDLSINTDLSSVINDEIFISNPLFSTNYTIDYLINMAIIIHNRFFEHTFREIRDNLYKKLITLEEHYNLLEDLQPSNFHDLDSRFKIANIRQAKSFLIKLNMVGYELADNDDEREIITEFSDEEVEDLAIFEHREWCEEKIGQGWVYGEFKDEKTRVTPYLVEWEKLDEFAKQVDRETVKYMPFLVQNLGFKVVLSKLRLLTSKIYNFSQRNEKNKNFDTLSLPLKKLNYKKTSLIIELLSKLDYNVVDLFSLGEAIKEFEKNEEIYLARSFHEEWCDFNNSLGWKFGENYDVDLKTNPNLLIWEKLTVKYAVMQVGIIKHLPKFCSEVGLKIVKNTYNI